MIKIIGCITVIAGCSMAGIIKSLTFRARRQEIEEIIELLRILEMEITYKKEPLHKTFKKVSTLKDCWFSTYLYECQRILSDGMPLSDAWNQAICSTKTASPLQNEDMNILSDFVMGLGKSDIGGQKEIFEPAIIRLENALTDAIEKERKQGKMYRGIGLSAGIIIAIMFI